MNYWYAIGTFLSCISLALLYMCIKLIYETVDLIMETVRICEFVRENPDKVTMEQTANEWDVPESIGLRGSDNPDREKILDSIREHEEGLEKKHKDID